MQLLHDKYKFPLGAQNNCLEDNTQKFNNSKHNVKSKMHNNPGQLSLKKVQKHQGHSKLLLSYTSVEGIIREIPNQYGCDLMFSKSSLRLLQSMIESYLVTLFQHANLVTLHAKRETVYNTDLTLVRNLRGETNLRFSIM